ncbi:MULTISPECIES: PAAR domain-containing protein [Burkholderia cepacia complex]|uniref:PAAR domain-containing protein n=1 Tax=Burkholderia cepacia complex TaxID=87882 RepID=UPI0009B527C2
MFSVIRGKCARHSSNKKSRRPKAVKRHYLRVGDKSTAGGVVTDGIATTSVMGQQLTHIGASVMCPACSSVGHIVPIGPRFPDGWMGQKVALEGDKVSCGCYPMPTMLPLAKRDVRAI